MDRDEAAASGAVEGASRPAAITRRLVDLDGRPASVGREERTRARAAVSSSNCGWPRRDRSRRRVCFPKQQLAPVASHRSEVFLVAEEDNIVNQKGDLHHAPALLDGWTLTMRQANGEEAFQCFPGSSRSTSLMDVQMRRRWMGWKRHAVFAQAESSRRLGADTDTWRSLPTLLKLQHDLCLAAGMDPRRDRRQCPSSCRRYWRKWPT